MRIATTGAGVRVETATSIPELETHAEAWDRLALAAPERLPMLSHAWTASFLETCVPPQRRWNCLFAYRRDELIGVLPVVASSRWGLRRLDGPVDDHTEFAHPLLAVEHAVDALSALTSALFTVAPDRWLRCHGVRDTSPLLRATPALTPHLSVLPALRGPGCYVDTTGSFEAYQARLSSSFRRSLRAARRKAVAQHTVEFEVVRGTEAARADLFTEFLQVEAAGWKGRAGSAIACQPAPVAFYSALARRLAARGWLEWNLLRFDGRVVAGHLGVRLGTSLLLPKGGYDETYAHVVPGNLLFWEVFSRAFDEPTSEVNFLTSRAWMQLWKMSASRYDDLVISPRKPVPAAAAVLAAIEPRRHLSVLAHRHPRLLESWWRARARLSAQAGAALHYPRAGGDPSIRGA